MTELEKLNNLLESRGLPTFDVVKPSDLEGQKINARHMDKKTFDNLVRNIKRDGKLESVPLVYRKGDKYKIISGHHRVKAAIEAGIEHIVVMITRPQSRDEVVYKQLSHNGLVGKDDMELLRKLYHSIQDEILRIDSGVLKDPENILKGVNFAMESQPGRFKTVKITVTEYDADTIAETIKNVRKFEEAVERYLETQFDEHEDFIKLTISKGVFDIINKMRKKIKKTEESKSDSDAFVKIVQLAAMKLKEIEENHIPDKEIRSRMLNEFAGKD
jgi:hypothetical protein